MGVSLCDFVVPLGDYVIVRDLPFAEISVDGVVLPEHRDDASWKAEVVAVSDDADWLFGDSLSIGDVVVVPIYEGEKLDYLGVRYRVFTTDDILAVLDGWVEKHGLLQ